MVPANLVLIFASCVGVGTAIAVAVQGVIQGYFRESLLGGAFLAWVLREIFEDR